jgi:surface antigen
MTLKRIALSLLTLLFSLTFLSPCLVRADTLGYPWPTDAEAPCQFGSAGGVHCTNPANSHDLYDWGVNSGGTFHSYRNGYQYRNCTDYVQWREAQVGVTVPNSWHNGGQWYDSAPASEKSTTPAAWDAAVVPGNPGHVAFVESVNADGTITVSEYNHDAQGHGDTRTASAASMGFTKFVDFGVHPAGGGPSGGGTSASNTRPAAVTRGPIDKTLNLATKPVGVAHIIRS